MASSSPLAETDREKEIEAYFTRLLEEKTTELDEFVNVSKDTETELYEHIDEVSEWH